METNIYSLLKWIPFVPLMGFIVNGLIGRKLPEKLAGIIGSSAIGISFIISILSFLKLINLPEGERLLNDRLYTWIASGNLNISISLHFDALSAVMALVVSGVSFLIHVYSIGYMAGDKGFSRYFAYLNLFVFFMLILVLADSLLIMFVGWEGVGLCSYLLIGFWYEDNEKASAGKKAFIVNRVGDAGFIIGLILLFYLLGNKGIFAFDFQSLSHHIPLIAGESFFGINALFLIGLLLFLGATGKSAQFPLYVWLPDAMAGPTPVSALIHAATMVTAGVYMLTRMYFLYELVPSALSVVLAVGCFTAVLGATIGLLQTDIKKVLAYSTISQIGYMFMAVGAGAFAAGVFHLMTHAFFKAVLFLGAGSVIHGLHGEQDMRKMGGLRADMKWTFLVMWLAISGIPPFAGFFSKDMILESVFAGGNKIIWFAGLITAAMTAYYISRLIVLTFFGEKRGHSAHESPAVMTIPLGILAVLCIAGGFIDIPHFLEKWEGSHHEISKGTEDLLIGLSVFAGIAGITFAFFIQKSGRAERVKETLSSVYTVILNKFYVDEIYDYLFVRTPRWFSDKICFRFFDAGIIDGGIVNGSARIVYNIGSILRRLQSGNAQSYALIFVAGVVMIIYFVLKRFI